METKYRHTFQSAASLFGIAALIIGGVGLLLAVLSIPSSGILAIVVAGGALLTAFIYYTMGNVCDYLADMTMYLDHQDKMLFDVHKALEDSRKRAAEKRAAQPSPVSDK